MTNAADLLAVAPGAAAIGEPLVEPLDHYGEVSRFKLPCSGLVIGRSTRRWTHSEASGQRPTRGVIEPNPGFLRRPTFEEFRSGADPVYSLAVAAP